LGLGDWTVAGFNGRSVGLYEGVEDGIRKYCLRVTEMVVFSKLGVDMEFLYCVKVCSFFVAVYYFHHLVHGAKRMGFFYQVFCKIGGIAVVAPCCLVFYLAGGELSTCLSDIRFVAVRAS